MSNLIQLGKSTSVVEILMNHQWKRLTGIRGVKNKCRWVWNYRYIEIFLLQSRGLPIPYPVILGPSAYIGHEEVSLYTRKLIR